MKKLLILVLALIITVSLTGCNNTSKQEPANQTPPQTQGNQTPPPTQEPSPQNGQDQQSTEAKVNIYLIAIEDHGKSGKDIGTGDSLVAVEQTISTPLTPLKAAFEALLAQKDQYYGQSGLYNALYRSTLKLDKATITNGKAEVYLSGTLSLGGVMDTPRVENQLTATAIQFSTVHEVEIYINNKPLKDALSLK